MSAAPVLEGALLVVRLLGFSAGVGSVFYGGVYLNYLSHDHREAVEWGFLSMGASFLFIFNNALLPASLMSTFFTAFGICLAIVTASVVGTMLWYEALENAADPEAYVGVDETPLSAPSHESDEETADE